MITKKQMIIGALLIIFTSLAIYVTLEGQNVRIRVDNDKTTFYIYENRWLISGVEYNKLFNGTRLVTRNVSGIHIETFNDSNSFTIIRHTPYNNGAKIIDTYYFEGNITSKENFPVSHIIQILNGKGLIFEYSVTNLLYNGTTKNAVSPERFGRGMKVSWESGSYWAKVYQSGILKVRYRVNNTNQNFSIRLFDPLDTLLPSSTHKAYYIYNDPLLSTPSNAVTVFQDDEYNKTNVSDNNRMSCRANPPSGETYKCHQRFTFNLSSYPVSDINSITYKIESYYQEAGAGVPYGYVYYKNQTSGVWIEYASLTTIETDYTQSFTSGFSDLINSTTKLFEVAVTGQEWWDVEPAIIYVYVDYAELQVNYTTAGAYFEYSLNSTNSTIAGTAIRHNLFWNSSAGLSGYIFSFDNCTGSFSNDTWTSSRITNQYNRSEDSIVTGTYSAGAVNNLNVLGEGSTYDVQEASTGTVNTTVQFNQSATLNITGSNTSAPSNLDVQDGLSYNVTEAVVVAGSTISTDLYATNSAGTTAFGNATCVQALDGSKCSNVTGGADTDYVYGSGYSNTSGGTINQVWITVRYNTTATSISDKLILEYSLDGGSTFGATIDSFYPTASAGWTNRTLNVTADRTWTYADIGNLRVYLYYDRVGGADSWRADIDALWVNLTYTTATTYRAEAEHNTTLSYSGTLQSINVSANFTTNVSSSFALLIYNFSAGNWYTCNSGTATTNTWYGWWCNITSNPTYYNSSTGVVRVRLNGTIAHENPALVREDYVQYYISNSSPAYRAEVYHNSSTISYTGSLSSVDATINFTTTATDTYYFDIYNWQSSSWVNCQSGSVTTNTWTKWWCNVTSSPTNYKSSDNKIKVRINSTADGDQGTLQEDYIQYYVNYFPNESWSNVTKIINSTSGCTIQWKVFANDTSNTWNTSLTYSYNTTAPIAVLLKDQALNTTFTDYISSCPKNETEPNTLDNDWCVVDPDVNEVFNVSFKIINSTAGSGTINATIRLKYGNSTNPHTKQATTNVSYTENCTGQIVILKNVYNISQTNLNFVKEGDGDIRIENLTGTSLYNITINWEIQFCSGTAGKVFDISPNVVVLSAGNLTLDSWQEISINNIALYEITIGGSDNNLVHSSIIFANLNGDSYIDWTVGGSDGTFYALSGNNGTQLWNYTTTGEIYSDSMGATNLTGSDTGVSVVFGNCNGIVYALNGTNGNKLWSYNTTPVDCISGIAIIDTNNDSLRDVIATSLNGKIYVFSGNNGTLLWSYTTGGSVKYATATNLTAGGTVYVYAGSQDGTFYVLNGTNGSQLWNYSVGSMIETRATVDTSTKTVYFGAYNGKVYALNTSTGTSIWNYTAGGNITGNMVLADMNNDTYNDVIFCSLGTKKVFIVNSSSGSLYSSWNILGNTDCFGGISVADVNDDTYNDIVFTAGESMYGVQVYNGFMYLIWRYVLPDLSISSVGIHSIDDVFGSEYIATMDSNKIIVVD